MRKRKEESVGFTFMLLFLFTVTILFFTGCAATIRPSAANQYVRSLEPGVSFQTVEKNLGKPLNFSVKDEYTTVTYYHINWGKLYYLGSKYPRIMDVHMLFKNNKLVKINCIAPKQYDPRNAKSNVHTVFFFPFPKR